MSNPATGENSAPIIKGSRILSEAFMADDKHIIPRRAVLCGRSLLPRGSGPVLDEHPAGSFLYHLSRGKKRERVRGASRERLNMRPTL